jgi:hypothetical protein
MFWLGKKVASKTKGLDANFIALAAVSLGKRRLLLSLITARIRVCLASAGGNKALSSVHPFVIRDMVKL